MINDDIVKELQERYGEAAQIIATIEELNELSHVLAKYLNKKSNITQISCEMADVKIMIYQVEKMLSIEADVGLATEEKIKKLIQKYL